MNITVEKTLEMPNAVLFARQLDSALQEEQKKREHFYKVFDETRRMEFINGEIIYHSPSPFCEARAFTNLLVIFSAFVAKYNLGEITFGKTLISLTRNDYEPDLCFFGNEKAKTFKPKQMQFPAPDFVVEVLSDSTAKNDREIKFQDYAAHGVAEYWIIDAEKKTVEQYILKDETYELLLKSNSGDIKSRVLPKFKIPIQAISDEQTNLKTLAAIVA